MKSEKGSWVLAALIVWSTALSGCKNLAEDPASKSTPTTPAVVSPTDPSETSTATTQLPVPSSFSNYQFPDSINPSEHYLFYLHGKIIEDQGLPAISPEFGEYQYEAILEALGSHGFIVISELRAKDTNSTAYARKIANQVSVLLDKGVPAGNITIAGASKGAWITIYVSHFLANKDINFIIMAVCNPEALDFIIDDGVSLYGNILSIYDSVDPYAGSCQPLISLSEAGAVTRFDEIVLEIGTGHGILYQPLDAWIMPLAAWVKEEAD